MVKKVDEAARGNKSRDFNASLEAMEACYKGFIGENNLNEIERANSDLSNAFDNANQQRIDIDLKDLNKWRQRVGWIADPDISANDYYEKCRAAMYSFLQNEELGITYENDNFNKYFKEALAKIIYIVEGEKMGEKVDLALANPDDVQSANALFNFVGRLDYLVESLEKKALVPRYCEEDIGYLKLHFNGKAIEKIHVLQKCFCDIPLHNITKAFPIEIIEQDDKELSDNQREQIRTKNTHVSLYGSSGIAFTKQWCIDNNLQPIQYINEKSAMIKQFRQSFECVLDKEDIDDIIVDELLNKLAYIKPLYGTMRREIDAQEVRIRKNFHDECEWRYIPDQKQLEISKVDVILFDEELQNKGWQISSNLMKENYSELWLKFNYEDIKYLFVPDDYNRNLLIEKIMGLPEENFVGEKDDMITLKKLILVSKIFVIEDIQKDW